MAFGTPVKLQKLVAGSLATVTTASDVIAGAKSRWDEIHLNAGGLTFRNAADDTTLMSVSNAGVVSIGVSGQDVTIPGNFTVTGTTTHVNSTTVDIADNILFVNSGPSGSANAGYALERYQTANNAGTGDVVSDENALVETLTDIGDQTGQDSTHVYLGGGSATVDFYVGMWIKSAFADGSNVRKVTAYNKDTKVATVATAWDTQPTSNTAVTVYTPYSAMLFDESTNVFRFVTLTPTNAVVANAPVSVGALSAVTVLASTGITSPYIKSNGGDFTLAGGNGAGGIVVKTNGTTGSTKLEVSHANGLTFYDDMQPDTDSAYNVGDSSHAWATGYFDTLTSLVANDRLKLGTDGDVAIQLPVFTTIALGNIATPAEGDILYDSTTHTLKYRNDSTWVSLTAAGDTAGLTGTTNISYTINSDGGGAADADASLVLISDDASNKDTGTLTYVAGTLGGSDRANYGTWTFAAQVAVNADVVVAKGSSIATSGWTTTGCATGEVVYATDADTVAKADADDISASKIIGVVNDVGEVVHMGPCSFHLDAAGCSAGDRLYASPTAGRVTATAPDTATQYVAPVGIALAAIGANATGRGVFMREPATLLG